MLEYEPGNATEEPEVNQPLDPCAGEEWSAADGGPGRCRLLLLFCSLSALQLQSIECFCHLKALGLLGDKKTW